MKIIIIHPSLYSILHTKAGRDKHTFPLTHTEQTPFLSRKIYLQHSSLQPPPLALRQVPMPGGPSTGGQGGRWWPVVRLLLSPNHLWASGHPQISQDSPGRTRKTLTNAKRLSPLTNGWQQVLKSLLHT